MNTAGPADATGLRPMPQHIDAELGAIRSLAGELESACSSLPRVDEEGNSECPFAEELWAKRDDLAKKLMARVPSLHEMLAEVEEQLARCRRNLNRILGDALSLSSSEAVAHYGDAERTQIAELMSWQNAWEEVDETTKLVERALSRALERPYPAGEPRERTTAGARPPDPPTGLRHVGANRRRDSATEAVSNGCAMSQETSDLLAMGPDN